MSITVTNDKFFDKEKKVLFSAIIEFEDFVKNLMFLGFIFGLRQDIVQLLNIE